MSKLNVKQSEFARCLGQLLQYAFATGQDVIVAEVFRPKETAELYAQQGKGIKNSVHTLKLAADLFRCVGGSVSWEPEHYEDLGRYWKTLHPDARWGGDFKKKDYVHFSFQHNGVK